MHSTTQLLKFADPTLGLHGFGPFFETYKRGLFETCESRSIILFEELVKVLLDTCVERVKKRDS